MGKGKGRFSYWAARVAVSQIVFEVSGQCHEQVVRDAMRLAAIKMPGMSSPAGFRTLTDFCDYLRRASKIFRGASVILFKRLTIGEETDTNDGGNRSV